MIYAIVYLLTATGCHFWCKFGFKMEWMFLSLVVTKRKYKAILFFLSPILLILFTIKRSRKGFVFPPPPPQQEGTPPEEGDFVPPID